MEGYLHLLVLYNLASLPLLSEKESHLCELYKYSTTLEADPFISVNHHVVRHRPRPRHNYCSFSCI